MVVTATNHNGSVQATSDPTATVAPPPAPAPTTTAATTTTTAAATPTATTTTAATTTAATTTTATSTSTYTSTNTSTTTATTTTTPLAPSYEFVGNFDTGDLSQWDWGAQCANTGTPSDSTFTRGSIYVNGTNRLQGGYSAEIDMPTSTHLRACEVLHQRTLNLGTDQWYADAINFPANWTEPSSASWGAAIGQFNYELIWGAPVEIMVHGSYANLVLQSGYCQDATSPTPGCPYTTESGGAAGTISANDRIIPTGTQLAGHWVELIIHAHWASDFTGVVEGWWRYLGGTWQKTVSISGYPTVQWSTARPLSSFCTNLGQSNCHVTTDKTGFYSGPSGTAFTVRNDGFVEASSFADAAAELP